MLTQDASSHRVYCFSCGAELIAEGEVLAPLCASCTAKVAGTPRSFYLLREEGRSEGPIPHDRLMERLRDGQIHAWDRIAESTGSLPLGRLSFVTVELNPEFSPWFTPGDPRSRHMDDQRVSRAREQRRRRWLRFVRALKPVGIALVLLGLAWVAWSNHERVLSQPGVQDAARSGEDAVKGALRTVAKALDPEVALQERANAEELPGAALLDEIRLRWPEPGGVGSERVALATQYLLRGTVSSLDDARRELEVAVVLDDHNVEALAALSVVYSRMGSMDPNMGTWSLAAFERAVALSPEHPAVVRAKAELALSGGFWSDAEALARQCVKKLKQEGRCLMVLGEALAQQGRLIEGLEALEQAQVALPDAPVVDLATGRVALLALRYPLAASSLASYNADLPDDSEALFLLAQLDYATGRRDAAARRALGAAALAPSDPRIALFAGKVLLHAVGRPEVARDLLSAGLAGAPGKARLRRDLLLHAAMAAGGAGRRSEALAWLQELLETYPGWAPAVLAQANLLWRAGDLAAAEASLRGADLKTLAGEDAARFQLALASFYARQSRQSATMDALERARMYAPAWAPARLALAEGLLSFKGWDKALNEIIEMWRVPPIDHRRDPAQDMPVKLTDPRAVAKTLYGDGQVPLEQAQRLALALSVLEAHACLAAGEDCAKARQMLESVLVDDPTLLPALVMLGQVALSQGRAEEAAQHFLLMQGNRVEDAGPLAANALALAMLGRQTDAEDMLSQARSAPDAGPWVDSWRVRALWSMGQTDEALDLARQHLTRDPADLGLSTWLAEQQAKKER